jgi:hypothetical protein
MCILSVRDALLRFGALPLILEGGGGRGGGGGGYGGGGGGGW